MSKLNFYYLLFFFIFTKNYISSSKAIILPLRYAIPNEPTIFEPKLIVSYYSKNDIYTLIKMGKPANDLTVVLKEDDSSFVIKEGDCPTESDYSVSGSSTFKYDQGLFYQYINYQLTTVLNNTRDKICLNQADKKYFYSSLKDRRDGKELTKIEIDDFSFLYAPNKEELNQLNKKKDKNKKDDNIKPNPYESDEDDYDNIYKNDDEYDNDDNPFTPYYPGDENDNSFGPKCGYLGVLPQGMKTGLNDAKINFIQQLKNKKIIDNYNWYIRYNKDKSGELIIGAAPHEVRPENYLEEDLYMTRATLINDLFYWQIDFSSVEIFDENANKKYDLGKKSGVISFNDNFIQCPKAYYNEIISVFFQPYIDKKICKLEYINLDTRYSTIYCHQRNFTESDLKKFPVLLMQSIDFNYIFNMDYNDLFLKTKNVYIFKIIHGGEYGYWKLGKIFLEKYPFVFNYDSKMFGFYQKFIPENLEGDQIIDHNDIPNKNQENDKLPPSKRKEIRNRENNKQEKKTDVAKIIIIIILIIVALLIGLYLVRRFYFTKQINSKLIENYRNFDKKDNKNGEMFDDADQIN